ncbi:hypothetical protein OAQ99_01830 [Candidatus Kapabacteria bacterium]|nr:hypothetical protein [Candidatus Kapabacteria bacterium]
MEKLLKDLISIFNFSFYKEENEIISIGSIVWGIIFRSFLLMVLSLILMNKYELYDNAFIFVVVLWFFIAWPAYNKFQDYNKKSIDFIESTLCGSCRNFEKTAQLCKIYDEHPTKDFIPCDGDDWELK